MFSITDQEALTGNVFKQRIRKALKPIPGKLKSPAYTRFRTEFSTKSKTRFIAKIRLARKLYNQDSTHSGAKENCITAT